MAAAAYSRSKGGPFFLVTLLCLVGLASSHKSLDNLKAEIQKAEERIDQWKAKRDILPMMMSETKSFTRRMMAAVEKLLPEESADDYPPVKDLFQSVLHLLDSVEVYVNKNQKVSDAKIAKLKLELEKSKLLVQAPEESHSEL